MDREDTFPATESGGIPPTESVKWMPWSNYRRKIMFADERMSYEMTLSEITSGALGTAWHMPGMDSAWEWPYDKLSTRHNGGANVTFADGHVQTVRPEFGEQPEHYDPLY